MRSIEGLPQPQPENTASNEIMRSLTEAQRKRLHAIRAGWARDFTSFQAEAAETAAGIPISLATDLWRRAERVYKSLLAALSEGEPTEEQKQLALRLMTAEVQVDPQSDEGLPDKQTVFAALTGVEQLFEQMKGEVGSIFPPLFTELIAGPKTPTVKPASVKSEAEQLIQPAATKPKPRESDPQERRKLRELMKTLKEKGLLEGLANLQQWPPEKGFKPENGPSIYYSEKPFAISADTSRRAKVVYVDTKKEIKPRVIYCSSSHGIIKTLPRVGVYEKNVVWFDKGDSQESISLGTPYQMQLMPLMYLDDPNIKTLDNEEKNDWLRSIVRSVKMGQQHKKQHRQDTFFHAIEPAKGNLLNEKYVPDEAMAAMEGIDPKMYHPGLLHLSDARPEACSNPKNAAAMRSFIEQNPDAYLPTKLNKVIAAKLPRYGHARIWNFESTGKTPLQYMVLEAYPPGSRELAVWVASINRVKKDDGSPMSYNTYLVPEQYDHLEPVTMPPVEHFSDVAELFGNSYLGNSWLKKFPCTSDGRDADMWPFIQHLPLNIAFKAKIKAIDAAAKKRTK